MTTYTPRLKLAKPNPVGEVVSVDLFNLNADEIDKAIGVWFCTSTTRPATPYAGMQIYETDTTFTLIWDGTDWVNRPWYIERYRDANIVLGAGQTAYKWNNTRLGVSAAATGVALNWGLTSFTEDKNIITLPATGMWDINWRCWTAPATLRTYMLKIYSAGAVREAIHQEVNGNAQGEFSSQFFGKKGDDIEFTYSSGTAATGGPDSRADGTARSYMKLRYAGPGSA